MEWREIKNTGEIIDLLPKIWQSEMNKPDWYCNSIKVWTPTFNDYEKWISKLDFAYGLFNNQDCKLIVYVEERAKNVCHIHLSVLKKIRPSEFVKQTRILRDMQLRKGSVAIRGWVLSKNFALIKLLRKVNFYLKPSPRS